MDLPQIVFFSINPISLMLLAALLLLSSFFSMSETVFSSLNPIRIKNYIEAGKKGSKRALWISERFDLTLSTILVGNNLSNIALASISIGVFSQIFSQSETFITVFNTLVMTILILIFGEIIPKSFGKRYADEIALTISGTLYLIIRILKPITVVFLAMKRLIIKDDHKVTISVTEDELETIIDQMEEEGTIDEDDAEMLQSVLDLRAKKVYEIMTPRVDMVAIALNSSVDEVKEVFFEHQFSRIPVFDKDRDNIVGILTERDFFTCLIKGEEVSIETLMKTPIFVAKSMRVDNLIETLQKQNMHLAVVSDEFGGTSGIVSMEDALEELVGEIYDEHDDIEEAQIMRLGERHYGVNADIDMDDLYEELDLGTPPVTDQSLGAFLFDQFEDLPEIDMEKTLTSTVSSYYHDQADRHYEITFRIKQIKDRRIQYVHVHYHEVNPNGEDLDHE